MLEGDCPNHVATTCGIPFDSILSIPTFLYVIEGLPPDCMQDIH